MAHLSSDALLDLVEGVADATTTAHVAACDRCRAEVASLRATLTEIEAGYGDVPEPSPLFWDHLSARVRAAVEAPPAPAPWWRVNWQPAAIAMGICAALVLAVLLRPPDAPRTPPASAPVDVAAVAPPVDAAGDVAFDESLDWLVDLATGVAWDDTTASAAPPDAAALAVGTLNEAERAELHRILQEALRGNGV